MNEIAGPDFIIAGAMKAGTTLLKYELVRNYQISMASGETHVLDRDDMEQHPDFWRGALPGPNDQFGPADFDNYARRLGPRLAPSDLLGEDATTYMASEKALRAITTFLPNTRLIVVLRSPADRAESHYWHLVRTGRVHHEFERVFDEDQWCTRSRGHYRVQIEQIIAAIGRPRLHVVLFDNLLSSRDQTLATAATFLEANPRSSLTASGEAQRPSESDQASARVNPGGVLLSEQINLLGNRVVGPLIARRFTRDSRIDKPSRPLQPDEAWRGREAGLVRRSYERLLRPYPTIDSTVRAKLVAYYRTANVGLGELVGHDLSRWDEGYR